MSGSDDGGAIERLRAKLDHERAKVRRLVEGQQRLSAERAAWTAERGVLERRLAVLEGQRPLLLAPSAAQGATARPLRVLVAGPNRKTIFQFVRGATISSDPSQAPFDLLVVPRPEKQDLAALAANVPEACWAAVRAGRTRVVLDGSSEGHLHRLVFDRIRAFAERTRTPLETMVYLTQDRLAAHQRFEVPLPVLNYDYYLHKALYPLRRRGPEAFEAGLRSYREAPRTGRRAFLSLNLGPRAHRVLLLTRLIRDGLWDRGFVSFGGFGSGVDAEAGAGRLLERIDWRGLEAAAAESSDGIVQLHRKGVILFGMPDGLAAEEIGRESLQAGDLPEYRRSWFSVVTETEMRSDSLRVTEKALKPALNFHPFVVLGSPGALRLVKSYDLQTFPELFDEAYDDEEDALRRFDMVYAQIRRLAGLDETELDRLEASVAEKVVFNARRALTVLPGLFQETLLPAAICRLLPQVPW